MSEINITINVIQPVKRCPFDGVRLVQQPDGSWKCPKCGYVELAVNQS